MKFKKIYVEITNHCNLNCFFCGNTTRSKKEMSCSEFLEVIKKIKPYTDYIYLHVKGEPLLHSDLKTILEICTKNNILVNITTNGTLLDKYEDLFLHSSCLRQINVSLHCEQNSSVYFEKVFTTCQKLSKKIYISYRLWTLKNNKLDKKSTIIVNKIKSFYNLSLDVVDKIYNNRTTKIDINTFVEKENLFTWPNLNQEEENIGYCHALSSHIAILVDGSIVPCCLDGEGNIILGNIFKDNLEEVISSTRFQNMLTGFRNNQSIEELCKHCNFKNRFNNR